MSIRFAISASALLSCLVSVAQTASTPTAQPDDRPTAAVDPTFVPMVKVSKALVDGDSIQYVELNPLYI